MRSFTTFDIQYAHRFYGFKGEAQYLHGHTGMSSLRYCFERGERLPEVRIQSMRWTS